MPIGNFGMPQPPCKVANWQLRHASPSAGAVGAICSVRGGPRRGRPPPACQGPGRPAKASAGAGAPACHRRPREFRPQSPRAVGRTRNACHMDAYARRAMASGLIQHMYNTNIWGMPDVGLPIWGVAPYSSDGKPPGQCRKRGLIGLAISRRPRPFPDLELAMGT